MTIKEKWSEERRKVLIAEESGNKADGWFKQEKEVKKEAERIFYNTLMPIFEQMHDENPTQSLLKVYIDASAERSYEVHETYPRCIQKWKSHEYSEEVMPTPHGVWNIVIDMAKAQGIENERQLEFNGYGPRYIFWLNLED